MTTCNEKKWQRVQEGMLTIHAQMHKIMEARDNAERRELMTAQREMMRRHRHDMKKLRHSHTLAKASVLALITLLGLAATFQTQINR